MNSHIGFPEVVQLPQARSSTERFEATAYQLRHIGRATRAFTVKALSICSQGLFYVFGGMLFGMPADIIVFDNTPLNETALQNSVFLLAFAIGVGTTYIAMRRLGITRYFDQGDTMTHNVLTYEDQNDKTHTTIGILQRRANEQLTGTDQGE